MGSWYEISMYLNLHCEYQHSSYDMGTQMRSTNVSKEDHKALHSVSGDSQDAHSWCSF